MSTSIEHPAVLEPLAALAHAGFEVEQVDPDPGGAVSAEDIAARVREDTLLVSLMHANNVTGVLQPVEEVARALDGHDALLHVDAAQSFGKSFAALRHPRIDMLSASAHKLYGPMGIGALVAGQRARERLRPLHFGGGQERGLRPGTQAVALAAGFGLAAKLAREEEKVRRSKCESFRAELFAGLAELAPALIGDEEKMLPHVACLAFPGIEAESAIAALGDVMAVSSGSACASGRAEPSHVFEAMGLELMLSQTILRLSWCHETESPDWARVCTILSELRV